jgi:hypothetical protein
MTVPGLLLSELWWDASEFSTILLTISGSGASAAANFVEVLHSYSCYKIVRYSSPWFWLKIEKVL